MRECGIIIAGSVSNSTVLHGYIFRTMLTDFPIINFRRIDSFPTQLPLWFFAFSHPFFLRSIYLFRSSFSNAAQSKVSSPFCFFPLGSLEHISSLFYFGRRSLCIFQPFGAIVLLICGKPRYGPFSRKISLTWPFINQILCFSLPLSPSIYLSFFFLVIRFLFVLIAQWEKGTFILFVNSLNEVAYCFIKLQKMRQNNRHVTEKRDLSANLMFFFSFYLIKKIWSKMEFK